MLALSLQQLFGKKETFKGNSCNNYSQDLKYRNISCGCGQGDECIAE